MSPIIGTLSGSLNFGRGGGGGQFIIASGGSISQLDGYRIHTFTSGSSTFSISSAPPNATVEVLVVGGGGAGGNGLAGGGGGGAVIHDLYYPVSVGSYNVVVAARQEQSPDRSLATGSASGRGYDSSFGPLTALGGGQGGYWDGQVGFNGGCGGGAGGGRSSDNRGSVAGGNAQTGPNVHAHIGGLGIRYPASGNNDHIGGGGGGAGCKGKNYSEYYRSNDGPDGGSGYPCSIDGTARFYAAGGGGSSWTNQFAGNGGIGGGGGGEHGNEGGKHGAGRGGGYNSGSNGPNGHGGDNTGSGGGGGVGNGWGRSPGGRGGSGIVIVRYPYLPTATGLTSNLGLTEATAAESAVAIKRAWPNAPDRAYWIRPTGQSQAYLVHCFMSIQGGGWELVFRGDSNVFSINASDFLGPDYAGWSFTTKAQCDAVGNYNRAGDTNAWAPTYFARDFTDCMIISNRYPDSKRIGVRFGQSYSSCRNRIMDTSGNRTTTTTLLFGDFNMNNSLGVRGDTNQSYGGGDFFVFKGGSDGHPAHGSMAGGNNSPGWSRFQVGIGRDQQDGSRFGGGFGCSSWQNVPFRIGGHYWGHGDSRNPSTWAWDRSSPFEGHAFYVRKEAP